MKRREFVQGVLGITAAGAVPAVLPAAAAEKGASDRVVLGPMKVAVTRLGIGTGTNGVGGSSNQTRKLGLRGLADLLEAAYDRGVAFWDSSDGYGSHPHIREALKRVPREKVAIMTKTEARTEREMRRDLDRYRRELGTDYVDILLLHYVLNGRWTEERKGAMAVLAEAREKGIVKTHGISAHSVEALRVAAHNPWAHVQMARINPAGVAMDGSPREVLAVLKEAKAQGKGVIGMKIYGAGGLTGRRDECLRFALAQDAIDCFSIGTESRQQLDDNIRRIQAASLRV